ncbi:MAG: NADPH-dependent glutamate synthase [Candidatus Omnitrophica bacterium]|nr:NADPH-dependent glutamate synthase [Candidatus Omnitrophota bacterium]
MPKIKMREQPPHERIKNFNEVALGLTEEEAVQEAKTCLQCKKASCVGGCPVEIDIPSFIDYAAKGEFDKALAKIREKNSLPAICGRVCPQEDQCEKVCILAKKQGAVGIGDLERFVADWGLKNRPKTKDHRPKIKRAGPKLEKVAIIGSGPAGLTCAGDLARKGYDVTIFESLHKPGGVLTYGIPEFRLPKDIVDREAGYVKSLGVNIEVNFLVGRTKGIDELKSDGFKAFFIGIGAGLPYFLGVEGENLNGIYSANEFLTRTNLMKSYLFPEYDTPIRIGEHVGVIGAGNVAMDSARCALRLGAKEVHIVYRRTESEMPARIDEIKRAKEEGIGFELLTHPTRFFGDEKGWVREAELLKNQLGEPDASGRRRPVPIKGSERRMKLDTVVCAIGQGPNPLLPSTLPDLKLNEDGDIIVDDNMMTSMEGVFAGGDIVTGAATVIEAMGAGKKAAAAIDRYLRR